MRTARGSRNPPSSSPSTRAPLTAAPAPWVAWAATLLAAGRAFAGEPMQDSPSSRRAPRELVAVANGNRDWGPAVLAGKLVVAGGPSGRGGLHAVDRATGKLRWSFFPKGLNGSLSTPPAIAGGLAIAPYGAANPGAVIAVSLATGKEVWRGPDPDANATVAAAEGAAFVHTKDGAFVALDVATGRERWRRGAPRLRGCTSTPLVRDGVVYASAGFDGAEGEPEGAMLFALDASTGEERWRTRAPADYGRDGVCLQRPVLVGNTLVASQSGALYAIDRETGRARFAPITTERREGDRVRRVEVTGLVAAGRFLVGMTPSALVAFEPATGAVAWEVPGTFSPSLSCTTADGGTLYFQGSPAAAPAAAPTGTLHALDLDTRAVLWSFARPTDEKHWPFGCVVADGASLWVDSYRALVKLGL
jgi:outer membrane protein assembly factor BamB